MLHKVVKHLAFSLIGAGAYIPDIYISKLQEFTHLKSLLNLLDVNCVLDVGANRGQFAHQLRAIGYRGFIFSFEPLSNEFSVLSASFKDDSRWKGHNIALGETSSSIPINVIPQSTVMSSLLSPLHPPPDIKTELIEVRRLDELLPSLISSIRKPRVFLKMDTQGYDLKVFKGAEGCIEQVYGLYSELSIQAIYQGMPNYLEALEVYEAAGFELLSLTTNSRTPSGVIEEMNCLMKRR